MRRFHSYGPVNPRAHFCVPRTALVEGCVAQLLGSEEEEGGHYFTIWAPRQSGKTWLMRQAIAEVRRRHGERFVVGSLSMQGVEVDGPDPVAAVLRQIPHLFQRFLKVSIPPVNDFAAFGALFQRGTSPFDRPLILLIDEFDRLPTLVIEKMIAQFRDLYLERESSLLHGLALIGVRAVLGVESQRGSPFNVQRSLHVPRLTSDEVIELFRQYQVESGQAVEPAVVTAVHQVTRGQPGLVGWLGELLVEKYNRRAGPITLQDWQDMYGRACTIEPNNTVMNLLAKARDERYRSHVIDLFRTSDLPFSFDEEWCNYLYLNGVIDFQEEQGKRGIEQVCRFSAPFVQLRLFNAFSRDMTELGGRVPAVDPRVDLTEVFARLDLPTLLQHYRDYLKRVKAKGQNPWHGQPRRADLHLREAVGHFHLYWWLVEACGRSVRVTPEFPTGNGKVDLHLRQGEQAGVIEVKSFTQQRDLPEQRAQAARYAASRGLSAATLAVFVPTEDEELVDSLCSEEVVTVDAQPVRVSLVAVAAA